MSDNIEVPVLIVGGGPVGMTLALNLARYGVRSMIVERNLATTRHPKMDLTNGRSMELFRRLDLVDALRDAGVPRDNPFDISWISSLTGHELHRFVYPSARKAQSIIDSNNDGSHAVEAPLRVSQIVIEPVLAKAVDDCPLVEMRFGHAFETFEETETGEIVAQIREGSKDVSYTVTSRFLAGCDGGGSRVRRHLGIELDGEMAVAGAYMVHFRTDEADLLQRWGIAWHYQSGSGTIIAQNDVDTFTLQAWILPGVDPATMRAEDVLEGWVGRKFDYEILQANPWTANLVVAQAYRKGNVVLAGDSAHQYIPTGGYGMNSGIADAAALSWVIAATLEGWGGPALLAAYESERKPTAWWHLEAARRHMGVRMEISGLYAEAGDLEAEGAEARRLEIGKKIAALGNAENESWGVELGYRYDESPIIVHEGEQPTIDPIQYKPTTRPGARLPHVFLEPGVSVHDRLGLYFTLVIIGEGDASTFERASAETGVPLAILRLGNPDLRNIYERDLILVRPDQHVAWRGDSPPADAEALLRLVSGTIGTSAHPRT